MAHSVSGHLKLRVAEYDELIRRLVPAYPAMRPVQLDLLALALPADGAGRRVLDPGGGTGALAAAIARRFSAVAVEIWDTDPEMLATARERCAELGGRVRYVARSFTEPLPPCDAVAACIALHHVKDLSVKAGIYRNIFAALRPGGLFVNADTAVCVTPALREHAFRLWAENRLTPETHAAPKRISAEDGISTASAIQVVNHEIHETHKRPRSASGRERMQRRKISWVWRISW